MPNLTRRRQRGVHQETWHIYYGDVRIGSIGERAGVPNSSPQWGWNCGFYPGMEPGTHRNGIAATFEDARAAFEAAWQAILPKLTGAQFDEYRYSVASKAEIRAMRARGKKLPTELPNSFMRCVCGVKFDSHKPEESYEHRAHIYAAQALDGIRR
jgi:hypothetical protein